MAVDGLAKGLEGKKLASLVSLCLEEKAKPGCVLSANGFK